MKKITAAMEVLSYFPTAESINVGCKNGNYYHIYVGDMLLGKGKSKKAAWISANRNIK